MHLESQDLRPKTIAQVKLRVMEGDGDLESHQCECTQHAGIISLLP